jgi:hypothetical protein
MPVDQDSQERMSSARLIFVLLIAGIKEDKRKRQRDSGWGK